jgi:D-xylose transport system ATP-binding protein
MGAEETDRMLGLLGELRSDHAILLVEHDMDAVFRIADRITVMKNGRVVGTARVQDITKDEALGMIILGKCPPGAVPGPGATAA